MGKGEETRERILEHAMRLASRDGLEGLTVGSLATELGLSKSGLFAHFGSKEALQVQVLQAAAQRFEETVVRPALTAPRGEPRLRAILERWLAWERDEGLPGGCIFIAAASELDDKPGPARDVLVEQQQRLLDALARAVRLCKEEGHFRADVDPEQLAFELDAIILGYHHRRRLMKDARADAFVRAAFERLLHAARAPAR
jgi:AcrR family transcriptional regulator